MLMQKGALLKIKLELASIEKEAEACAKPIIYLSFIKFENNLIA